MHCGNSVFSSSITSLTMRKQQGTMFIHRWKAERQRSVRAAPFRCASRKRVFGNFDLHVRSASLIKTPVCMNEAHIVKIAGELKIQPRQVLATAKLFAEGATVPFIARYRKEATGTLDEVAITT